ncbi:MAG: EamA family transporter [Chloroflexi bacterium]|nr:EamA family transporter [Chloroflexota bacterium]
MQSIGLALVSIALWSFLALLSARVSHLPPFLTAGIALCVSGIGGLVCWRAWRVPLRTIAVGVAGIFGYHLLYFVAFRHAPPVEVSLMNYLWPLLIVLLSPAVLPAYRLRVHHLTGALLGLCGAGLIVTGGHLGLDLASLPGYLSATGAALIWAIYSLAAKRLPPFPTATVGVFCLLSGVLSLSVFWATADAAVTAHTPTPTDWVTLMLMGAGPLGAAFFTWKAAMTRGDPRVIGSLAYITPLTSTLVLVALDDQPLGPTAALAMVLIVGGAILGSLDLIRRGEVASAGTSGRLSW